MKRNVVNEGRIIYKYIVSENLPRNAYSMHVHNTYEIIYFVDGDATHVIEERKYKLKKGDLIFIRPFQYHFIQIDNISKYERYSFHFDKETSGVEGIDLFPEDVEVINLLENPIAEDIFRRLDVYTESMPPDSFAQLLPHLLTELLYNVHFSSETNAEKSVLLSPVISKALKYINKNLCTIKEVKEIAEHVFVTEGYLFRLFRNELHQSPKKYIREKRLLLAQKMLLSGITPTEACEKSGFLDYTTFYRNYCDFFGHSPQKTIDIN